MAARRAGCRHRRLVPDVDRRSPLPIADRRAATQRASELILRAEDELAEAGSVIANGYLRLDREEWIRVVEKHSAALADR